MGQGEDGGGGGRIVHSLYDGAAQGGPRRPLAVAGARHALPHAGSRPPRVGALCGGRPKWQEKRRLEEADRRIGQTPVGGGLCYDAPWYDGLSEPVPSVG